MNTEAMRDFLDRRTRFAGYPERHRLRLFEPHLFHRDWAAAMRAVNERMRSGAIVALVGTPGTGKTQIAVCAGARVSVTRYGERYGSVRYATAKAMFLEIQEAFKDDYKTERKAREKFITPDLLIVDEAQVRSGTPWEAATLTSVVDARYGALRDTILITNTPLRELAETLGQSVVDRLRETGIAIECTWKSLRTKPLPTSG